MSKEKERLTQQMINAEIECNLGHKLQDAIRSKKASVVEMIVRSGFDVERKLYCGNLYLSSHSGFISGALICAIGLAAQQNALQEMKILIQSGISIKENLTFDVEEPEFKDDVFFNPLEWAALSGSTDCAQELLNQHAFSLTALKKASRIALSIGMTHEETKREAIAHLVTQRIKVIEEQALLEAATPKAAKMGDSELPTSNHRLTKSL